MRNSQLRFLTEVAHGGVTSDARVVVARSTKGGRVVKTSAVRGDVRWLPPRDRDRHPSAEAEDIIELEREGVITRIVGGAVRLTALGREAMRGYQYKRD